MGYSPREKISELFQVLTRGKQEIGLLLGAGCPNGVDNGQDRPFIPGIEGLTDIISESLEEDDQISTEFEDLREQIPNPDVEKILDRIRGLKRYVDQSDEEEEADSIKGFTYTDLVNLERKVTSEIIDIVDRTLPDSNTPYHSLANWIGSIEREKPVQLFTTNYDLLLEQAFESRRVPYFDGFIGAYEPFFDSYAMETDQLPPRWARLWKIHGSINWKLLQDGDTKKVYKSGLDADSEDSVVVHPSHLKYQQSRKMPYMAMMDKLRNFLSSTSSVLITVGYSFGDQHLNDVIAQGLHGSISSAVYGLLYGPLDQYPQAIDLGLEIGNLSLLASGKAIVGTEESSWMPKSSEPDSDFPEDILEWEEDEDEEVYFPKVKLGRFESFGVLLREITGSPEVTIATDE